MKKAFMYLTLGLVAVAVVAGGAGATALWVVQRALPAPPGREATAPRIDQAREVVLDPFLTNLADADRSRYLQSALVLVVRDEAGAKQVERERARIRDAVLASLRARTSLDLAGAGGKDRLAETVGQAVAPLLAEGVLVRVLVTDMVVQ